MENQITIGNATYLVHREFNKTRTIQDAIRESLAPRARINDFQRPAQYAIMEPQCGSVP
jgi:hypothetical protein